jgi:hypothetical protein
MNLRSALRAERPLPLAMGVIVLPWLAVVLATAGGWAVVSFLFYAIAVSAAGYAVVAAIASPAERCRRSVLAPAAGVLLISSITALSLRLGTPLSWAPLIWLAPAVVGALWLLRDRRALLKSTVTHIGALALLSAIICLIFFLPGATRDAVQRGDGSVNWIYVDTQYFYSMAASIKSGGSPPRDPGTATEELIYHFGPYTPAATLTRLTGISLRDSFARVTRGVELWALILSCFGLGSLLSLKANGTEFGGPMSVAGLFFYGSVLSLFSDEANSASHISGAILVKIPGIDVWGDGGPFSHLILGHSVLHGLVAITAIMGLCFTRPSDHHRGWRDLVLFSLPALAAAENSIAALYCLAVVSILVSWGRLGQLRSWIGLAALAALFFVSWNILGYHQAHDVPPRIDPAIVSQWWMLAVWLTVGLGIRITALRWISRPLKDPVSVLLLATMLGFLVFTIMIQLAHGEQRYGIYFLQSVLSIFAFARLAPGWWSGKLRSETARDWLRLSAFGLAGLVACVVLIRAASFFTHQPISGPASRLRLLIAIAFTGVLAGTSALMSRSQRWSLLASRGVMATLLLGFLAWITPWIDFALGRMKMDITLTAGEVQGLMRLDELSRPGEEFATNKHILDSLVTSRERSYAYGAVSERPVLLEGFSYRGQSARPGFQELLRDNDLLFTTTSPETLKQIAVARDVRWLVARPGTDISLPKPLPPWLIEEQGCGTLKIYKLSEHGRSS